MGQGNKIKFIQVTCKSQVICKCNFLLREEETNNLEIFVGY